MDVNANAGACGPYVGARSACAGPSSRKRPYPAAGANQGGDGDVVGDGNDSVDPASRRQRTSIPRPLSLLARCALNRGGQYHSQHSLGGQNQQFQLPTGLMGIGNTTARSAFQHNSTTNHIQQLIAQPQPAHDINLPGNIRQNSQLQVINPQTINQEMAGMHQNMLLHQGQSQPTVAAAALDPQCLAAMQLPSTGTEGSLLRPFGMSPQELLNYAVLVNILQKSIATGNATRANLAYNCSQAMVNSIQAGNNNLANSAGAASASNPPAQNHQNQQDFSDFLQLARPNNGMQIQDDDNANGGSSSGSRILPGGNNTRLQQLEPVTPNQSEETTPNGRVQARHDNDRNKGGFDDLVPPIPPLGNYRPQQEACRELEQLTKSNQPVGANLINALQAERDGNADFGGGDDQSLLEKIFPPQQGCDGPDQTAAPNNLLHITGLSTNSKTVTMDSGRGDTIDGHTQSIPERNDAATAFQPSLGIPDYSNTNTMNSKGLHNAPPANRAHTNGISIVNANAANIQITSRRNVSAVALPGNVLQVQQSLPIRRSVPLWASDDEQRLSTQQCWLRKQIETFPASTRDVRTRGRNRLLDLGQVGIQCIHCKNLPQEGRGKGSSYFPASIKSIYQSAQNMLTFHFKEDTCPLIPQRLLQQMRDAGETSAICPRMAPKAGKSRAGGGKPYWEAAAATVTGLVDTTVGIRYSNDVQNFQPLESIALGTAESELDRSTFADTFRLEGSVLTKTGDKGKVTDFCFILMSQFGPYCTQVPAPSNVMMDGDDWDSDIENEETVASIGIVCQFCRGISTDGKQSKGIFLSSKADTMSRNKNMARMYNHLLLCASEDVKIKLMQAKNIHLPQSDRLKKGWKKQFFEKVCNRLHESLEEDGS